MKRLSLIAAAILLFLPAANALAQEPPPPLRVAITVLGLSEDQVHAWIAAIQSRDAAVQPIAQQLEAKHQALAALLQDANADPAAVGRLVLDSRALEGEIGAIAHAAAAAMQEALTPEQRERLEGIRNGAPVCDVIPAFRAVGIL